MKRIITIFAAILITIGVFSQSPEKMSYQAVIRNNSNALLQNTKVGMKISILKGSASGTAVYVETQTPTTNANGLISIEIGGSDAVVVTGSFSTIDWTSGSYYIKTETDPAGNTTYTITGTSQLLSVPYALYAKTSGHFTETQSLSDVAAINNEVNTQLKKVTEPTDNQDAATKSYVDALISKISNGSVVIDIDRNFYSTVRIGTQVWMVENLKTTKYNNGSPIPLVTDATTWKNLTTPAYCWYNNDSIANGHTYGALYNWYTASNDDICPLGWHVPTDADWTTLTDYLGGLTNAGDKLKEAGAAHWQSPNSGATNESGFTALPGGLRDVNGTFLNMFINGLYWSSTAGPGVSGYFRYMFYDHNYITKDAYGKALGFSVRCLRD